MKGSKVSWVFIFLHVGTTVAGPGVNINNVGPSVQGRKIENLNYGTLRNEKREALDLGNIGAQDVAARAAEGGIDANRLINDLEQTGQRGATQPTSGQRESEGIDANEIIDSLVNGQQEASQAQAHRQSQGLPKGAAGQFGPEGIDANAIINGLASSQSQRQGYASTGQQGEGLDVAGLLNNIGNGGGNGRHGQGQVPGLGQILNGLQENGRGHGNGVEVIEIKETIIQLVNGHKETQLQAVAGSSTTSTTTSVAAQGHNATATAGVTVIAGGAPAQGQAAAVGSNSSTISINSATLTRDGIIATGSVAAAGSPVTVLAGQGGNATAAAASNVSGSGSAVVVIAGGSSTTLAAAATGHVGTTTTGNAGNTVGVIAGGAPPAGTQGASSGAASINSATLTRDGLVGATTTSAAGSAVGVIAGGNPPAGVQEVPTSTSAALINSATLTKDGLVATTTVTPAGAAATVIAGGGAVNNASAQANGQCRNCVCQCGNGNFPPNAPQAPPFQLQTIGAMPPPASTLQTVASGTVTVIAGGDPPAGATAAAENSSTPPPIDSATLTTNGLIATAPVGAPGNAVTIIMSGSGTAASPGGSFAPIPPKVEVSTGAPSSTAPAELQSQVELPTPISTQQADQLPFDISTIVLQSRVTVNLGRREAIPTGR